MRKPRLIFMFISILAVSWCSSTEAQQSSTLTWSSSCANCESSIGSPGFYADGSGIFMEGMHGRTVAAMTGLSWTGRYFSVYIGFGLEGGGTLTVNPTDIVTLETDSSGHMVLRPLPTTDKRVLKGSPVEKNEKQLLRDKTVTLTGDQVTAGWVLFPADNTASRVTVIAQIGSETFRFPFARNPDFRSKFGDPGNSSGPVVEQQTPAPAGQTASSPLAQNAPSTGKNVAVIAKEASGAVISIVMVDKRGHAIAQGSGFLVSRDGWVVTNYHVIKSGNSAVVKLRDGSLFTVDGVLAFNKDHDVALIKVHGTDFRILALGDSSRLLVGEEVVAIGSPLSLEYTVSNGIVSGIRHTNEGGEGRNLLQTTAPISPGSSGGPLFNMAGEVVGITTSHLEGGENLNFAIPINDAKTLMTRVSQVLPFPDEPDDAKPSTK